MLQAFPFGPFNLVYIVLASGLSHRPSDSRRSLLGRVIQSTPRVIQGVFPSGARKFSAERIRTVLRSHPA